MKSRIRNTIRFTLGLFFWIYIPIKVFIFDIDLYFFQSFLPDHVQIINWKFLFFLVIFLLHILFFGFKATLITTLYISFFPFIIFFKGLFKFIKDNYIYIFSLIQKHALNLLFFTTTFISNLLKHFKFRLYSFLLFCIAILFSLSSKNLILLEISQYYILLYLFIHFSYRIYTSLAPPNVFTKLISSFDELEKKSTLKCDAQVGTEKIPYEEHKLEELSILAFFVVKGKILFQHLKESPRLIIYFILSLLYTILLTIFSLALVHYAEYKIIPTSYQVISHVSFYNFLHFSLSSLLLIENYKIVAVGDFSNMILTISGILRFVIGGIYTVLLLNVVKNQYNYTLNSIIRKFDVEERKLSQILSNRFNAKIEDSVENFTKLFDPKNRFSLSQSKIITAKLAIQSKNLKDAKKILNEISTTEDTTDEVYYLLGYIHGEDGEYSKMKECFANSIRMSSKYEKNINDSVKYYWSILFNKGVQFFNEGTKIDQIDEQKIYFSKSANFFKQALELDPASQETKLNYFYALFQTGEEETVLLSVKEWILADPNISAINLYSSLCFNKISKLFSDQTSNLIPIKEIIRDVENILVSYESNYSHDVNYLENLLTVFTIKNDSDKIEAYKKKIEILKNNTPGENV